MADNHREYNVTVGDRDICIVDLTITTRPYKAWKYIKGFLAIVPPEDLGGLRFVVLHDDSDTVPNSVPGTIRGSYGNRESNVAGAQIHIYLNWSLGIYPFLPQPTRWAAWNIIRNRFFIALFGKSSLAEILFHEIAHHHFANSGKVFYDEKQEEEAANEYKRVLHNNAFPRAGYLHYVFYLLFRKAYHKDFENIVDLWDSWLQKRGYSTHDHRLTEEELQKIDSYRKPRTKKLSVLLTS
jgi:hypothetical protein